MFSIKPFQWNTTFYGQSPGDLLNKKNGFAGRFSGYKNSITQPYHIDENDAASLPLILIIGDSILGDICLSNIRENLKTIANVNFLQQPHHCKNIQSWLDIWKVETWKYDIIFFFDGMHGFPARVTEEEWCELTPLVIKRLKKETTKILWGNCTPIPADFPQGNKNSKIGPNSKEQVLTNTSVIDRNNSIEKIMCKYKIPVLNLYDITYPKLHLIQGKKDIHFNNQGQLLMSQYIIYYLKQMLQQL